MGRSKWKPNKKSQTKMLLFQLVENQRNRNHKMLITKITETQHKHNRWVGLVQPKDEQNKYILTKPTLGVAPTHGETVARLQGKKATDLHTCLVLALFTLALLLISFVTHTIWETLFFVSFLFLFFSFFDFFPPLFPLLLKQLANLPQHNTLSQEQVCNASATLNKLLSIG